VKITPSHRVYALGLVLLIALAVCARKFGNLGAPSFLIPLGVGGLAYLAAIREFFSAAEFPRRVIVFGLVLAAAWHVLFLLKPPGADDDIHRYVWDGRVQRLGYNPYVVVPNDPALGALHTAETRTLNHPDLPSPYPAGAELFFRGVMSVHESVVALKVAFLICEVTIVFVLSDLLRGTRQASHWVLAYAWNPLLAIEVAGSGHVDIVGALLLMVSIGSLLRGRRIAAAVTFALAVSVKFLPIVLLPLYWKRVRVRDAALATVVFVLLYLPFLNQGQIPLGSLVTYVHSFRFNDPVFAALEGVATPRMIAAFALAIGLVTAVWMRWKSAPSSPDAFAWPMAASLLCAPVVYPWYLIWMLPFLWSTSTVPITIWTVSILPTYYVWHLRATGHLWILPGWIVLLEYGSVVLAAAIIGLHRVMRSGRPSID
jgi:alpha-1,6-mannosyltransferase